MPNYAGYSTTATQKLTSGTNNSRTCVGFFSAGGSEIVEGIEIRHLRGQVHIISVV
jgi:hypothetical protein